jgi:hypothetical protein
MMAHATVTRLLVLLSAHGIVGCGRPSIPDPAAAARAYAQAAKAGDADALYGMLTAEAKRDLGRQEAARLVRESKRELAQKGEALSAGNARVEAIAEVRYDDGEAALLELEAGVFRVGSAGSLPSRARTPAQALDDFRRALARRSYAALLGVLSSETRSALENDLRSLVSGLENPETLDIKVSGDTAEVEVPGGHLVKLKREAGIWHVEDFD